MNDILKQRLVGALVLIGLGVIFWPVIFVETEQDALDRSTQVEPMPVLDDVVIPEPQPLENVEPVSAVEHAVPPESQPDIAPEPEQPAPRPALDESGIPVAWVLQVVSVSSVEKAEAITAQLVAQGHKAYHRSIRRDGAVLHRIFIGPVFERDRLVALKAEIDKQLDVNAIIARYVP